MSTRTLSLLPLLLSAPPLFAELQSPTEEAAERQAAVETQIAPRNWVEGYEFSLTDRMRSLNVPGVSIAVIHEGKLDWAAGYGVRDAATGEPVTTRSMFQAASISKPVGAMLAMRLAQVGKFDLEASVNDLLTTWQLPAGRFRGAVTARHILSHTGGLGVHGFPGYRTFDPLPSVVEVLDGAGPANTGAVRRVQPLAKEVRYSGGGSTLLQLALTDHLQQDFTALAASHVLERLGMSRSTYAQPLPTEVWGDHCAAHGVDGRVVPGRFHVYPEQLPAGLWTTPSDLARFVMEIQRGLAGEPGDVLDVPFATRMLEPQLGDATMGLFLESFGGETWFGHGGSNQGFKAQMYGSLEGGRGVIAMSNGEQGHMLNMEIVQTVARVYGWPGFGQQPVSSTEIDDADLERYAGRYGTGPDQVFVVRRTDAGLTFQALPGRVQHLAPIGKHQFIVRETGAALQFHKLTGEKSESLEFTYQGIGRAGRLPEHEYWPIDALLEGDIEYAVGSYRDVYQNDPTDPMVADERLSELAGGIWNAGIHDEAAIALAELTCELSPEDPSAWYTLAEYRAALGRGPAAAAALERCLELATELGSADGAWFEYNARSMLRGL